MHFGEQLNDQRFAEVIRFAYEQGVRTFVTADVYGVGRADEMLGEALAGIDRSTYCLVGTVGHDIYEGVRDGSTGYPRFTEPSLRGPEGYEGYLKMATEKSLERCRTDYFDMVMLHNPDERGYTSDAVWQGMAALKEAGLTKRLGVAPGPANGFAYDLIHCFERYCELIDWAMLILNPLEPWPGGLVLPAAEEFGVKVLARVLLKGQSGPIDGVTYGEGLMPPLETSHSDEQIAAVLTYVGQRWHQWKNPVDPALVAQVRKETAERKQPWTHEELKTVAK